MIHPRSEWTQREPAWSPARRGVGDIFIHHEGGAVRGVPTDKPQTLREIESGVLGKGYIAIDYNLMVFNDGDVWAGRGLEHEDGATIYNNPTSVSICAVGNYEREDAPDALIAGIRSAVAETVAQGWASFNPHIRPHRYVFPTACPGKNLFARMDAIRATGAPAPIPAPEEDDMPNRYVTHVEDGNTQWWWFNGAKCVPVSDKNTYFDLGLVKSKDVAKVSKAQIQEWLAL